MSRALTPTSTGRRRAHDLRRRDRILQGRAVGGTTVVNYTSSFVTPPQTLKHWADVHEVKGHGVEEMAPWFKKMQERLHISPWAIPPNPNNRVLAAAAESWAGSGTSFRAT